MNSKYKIGNTVYQVVVEDNKIEIYKMKILGIYYTNNYEYEYKVEEWETDITGFEKEENLLTFEQIKSQLDEWK